MRKSTMCEAGIHTGCTGCLGCRCHDYDTDDEGDPGQRTNPFTRRAWDED